LSRDYSIIFVPEFNILNRMPVAGRTCDAGNKTIATDGVAWMIVPGAERQDGCQTASDRDSRGECNESNE
jgi:hypothetical protein